MKCLLAKCEASVKIPARGVTMSTKLIRNVLMTFVLSFSFHAYSFTGHQQPRGTKDIILLDTKGTEGDKNLVQAVESNQRTKYVSGSGMKVIELMPDDTQGSPHQKFRVQLSNGRSIMIISNLDMCVHVPVQVGDSVGAGGEFIPTGKASGLLHWVHRDPKKQRPDGYIELNGQVYCK
jgi:hypothetical protein